MKIAVPILLALLVACLGCQSSEPVTDVQAETAAIEAVLQAYIEAVETEDMTAYAQNVVHDENMINFGAFGPPIMGWSGLQEVMSGQNEALSQIKIIPSETSVHLSKSGLQAWATSQWVFSALMGEQPISLNVRCTWVLDKHEIGWLITHFHKSVSAG
jgi:ketosteroid isomerase-like protein